MKKTISPQPPAGDSVRRLVRRYRIMNGLGHEVGTVATFHEPIPAYAAKVDARTSTLVAAGYKAVEIPPNSELSQRQVE